MKKILLELPDDLAALVDSRRGNQPRVAWIRDAITTRLDVPCETIHKPDPDLKPWQEDMVERVTEAAAKGERIIVSPPPIHRSPRAHHPACKCPICQPVKEGK